MFQKETPREQAEMQDKEKKLREKWQEWDTRKKKFKKAHTPKTDWKLNACNKEKHFKKGTTEEMGHKR